MLPVCILVYHFVAFEQALPALFCYHAQQLGLCDVFGPARSAVDVRFDQTFILGLLWSKFSVLCGTLIGVGSHFWATMIGVH
jgi:hypothetical protein